MITAWVNTTGLIFTLVGVLILFRYGMPFHVPTGGIIGLALEHENEAEKKKEKRYRRWGYAGLFALILGIALQITASFPEFVNPIWHDLTKLLNLKN